MREIKFRAWDKQENVVRSVLNLFANGHIYVDCNCGPTDRLKYHSDKTRHNLSHHLNSKDCELMQYTGLRDKKETEIYEGDICTFYWNPIFNEPSVLFELKAPVIFYDKWSSFCFEIRKAKSSGKQLEIFDELGDADLYVAVGSPITHGEKGYGVEVIGNIYQNPELLK